MSVNGCWLSICKTISLYCVGQSIIFLGWELFLALILWNTCTFWENKLLFSIDPSYKHQNDHKKILYITVCVCVEFWLFVTTYKGLIFISSKKYLLTNLNMYTLGSLALLKRLRALTPWQLVWQHSIIQSKGICNNLWDTNYGDAYHQHQSFPPVYSGSLMELSGCHRQIYFKLKWDTVKNDQTTPSGTEMKTHVMNRNRNKFLSSDPHITLHDSAAGVVQRVRPLLLFLWQRRTVYKKHIDWTE